MLPVYEAIDVKQVISEKSGHTRPWVILAQTPEGIKPFVVKLYTTAQITSRNSVTAEVVGNCLSGEFDLRAPRAAFISFSQDFIMRRPPDQFSQLEKADERVKFATEVIEGFKQFDPMLSKRLIEQKISIDTLYAFDNFIRNGDRGDQKPNILLTKANAWLIDHEMALDIDEDGIQKFDNSEWEPRFATHHIFQPHLKKSFKRIKSSYFETFQEYLRTLNLSSLNLVFDDLENHDYITNRKLIMDYLLHLKGNSTKFVTLLKTFVS